MHILGIETSCDETSVSVVRDGRVVLSNVVASSLKDHQKFGGIIPEIASRKQLDFIHVVTLKALETAGITLKDIDAIAYTREPGLVGSLLVGISFANSLSFALGKPLIPVNHIHAHIYANYLVDKKDEQVNKLERFSLPAVGLVVSGGHSSLFTIKDFRSFKVFGQTRDDAVGEAYDKVARILDLGYPGGPVIDKLARAFTDKPQMRFSCAPLKGTNDFSFSGVKTAVLYHFQKHAQTAGFDVSEVACAFQKSVVQTIVAKSIEACQSKKLKTLLVGGGVAANSFLRERLTEEAEALGMNVSFPSLPLCMDNAAMIAGLGYHLISHKTKVTRHKKEIIA